MTVLWVALGAAVGAPSRYLLDRFIQRRHSSRFPWGTFTVNAVACLVLGGVTGAALPVSAAVLVGTGFCGSLSTYSTYATESTALLTRGSRRVALVYGLGSVVVDVALAALGWWITANVG